MSIWPIAFNPAYLYFITTRAVRAAHLFQREAHKQIILDSWAYMQTVNWFKIYAFVIMPNHIHLIAQCAPAHPVSEVVRDFKKYTAKQIIAAYKAADHVQALSFLQAAAPRPTKQTYAVWDDDFMAREVFSPWLLWQKINYIHNNPLQPHWCLAEKPEDYLWSSARFYLCNQAALIPLADARLLVG